MRTFGPRPQQTLIQSLCQPGGTRHHQSSLHAVFPHLKRTPNFHCTSFFRTSQVREVPYDPWQPLEFRDGRIYEILEIRLQRQYAPDIPYACCIDTIEKMTSEFIPFEVLFYNSAFEEGRFEESNHRAMMEYARQWAWEFLFVKRNSVDWSRYGHPYICECR